MLERGAGANLADEPLRPHRGGDLRPQDLDRDLAAVLHVLGDVDDCHPALSNSGPDAISVGQGLDERRDEV